MHFIINNQLVSSTLNVEMVSLSLFLAWYIHSLQNAHFLPGTGHTTPPALMDANFSSFLPSFFNKAASSIQKPPSTICSSETGSLVNQMNKTVLI